MNYNFISQRLEQNEKNGLRRELTLKSGLDFISNDYLGFAKDFAFQDILKNRINCYSKEISGSKSSRLLAGQTHLLFEVENILAKFSNSEDAIFFPSGYQANVSLLSSLIQAGDLVVSDEYNHASLIDGIRLSRGDKKVFRHNNMDDLESLLKEYSNQYENIFIVCESVYSMEGSITPLNEIAYVASSYGAYLIVDESHATGLFSSNGSGLVNDFNIRDKVFCTIHTGGKALGASGAWIAGAKALKDYLTNFSRGFIYSTAPSPLQLLSLWESVNFLKKELNRKNIVINKANALREIFKSEFKNLDYEILGDSTPIVPIVLRENGKVMNVMKLMEQKGVNTAGVRYPTVPESQARLRISINFYSSESDIEFLVNNLVKLLR